MSWRKTLTLVGGNSKCLLVLGAILVFTSACTVDFDEPGEEEDPAGVGRSLFGLSTDHINVKREKAPDKWIRISENDNSGSKGPVAIGPKKLPPAVQRYIVVLNDVSLEPGIDTEPGLVALHHGVLPDATYRHAIKGFSARISDIAKLKRLRGSSAVKYIQPDYRMYKLDQREIPYGRNRIDAELNRIAKIDGQDDNPDTDGIPDRVGVNAAIIDTGIDFDHFDLNVGGGADFVVIDKLSRDGISSPNGGDDIDGHGTHCAGIVGALDNGYNTGATGHRRAVTGVAPGAKVYSVRVLDANGSGYTSEIINGIDWMTCCVQGGSCDPACPAGAEDIRVANMSLGCECGTEDCSCEGAEEQAFWDAINSAISAGITIVTSAGNDSIDVGNESSCGATPGCLTNVITVAALTDFDGQRGGLAAPGDCDYTTYSDDTMAGFSNYGAKVELTAPGVCIDSTYPHTDSGYCTHCGAEVTCPVGKVMCGSYQDPGRYVCCDNAGCAKACVTTYCPTQRDTVCSATWGSPPATHYWCCYYDQDYADLSGTSMAAPHVTGGAALYIAEYEKNNGAYPTPAQVKSALTSGGDAAPCGGGNGSQCSGSSPNEVGLYVGEHRDSIEVSGYSVDFMMQSAGGNATVVTGGGAPHGSDYLDIMVHDEDAVKHGYACVKFCLSDNGYFEPIDDYIKASMQIRLDDRVDWTGIGISGENASEEDVWLYWWWIRGDGTVLDEEERFSGATVFQDDTWHFVEITVDRRPGMNQASLKVDSDAQKDTGISLDNWYATTEGMKCIFVLSGITDDTYQDVLVDSVSIRGRPEGGF